MSASERAMFELEHGDGVGIHFAHIAVKGHPLVEAVLREPGLPRAAAWRQLRRGVVFMTRVEHPRAVPRNLRRIAGCALLLGVIGGAQHPFVVVLLRVFAERHHAVDERRENQ